MEELKDIGKMRRKLGLTQIELAHLSGVSQSLIAKLERGLIDVAYSKAQQIFRALEKEERKEEVTADQLMTRDVKGIRMNDKVKKAIEIMEKLRISQLPVMQREICIGTITEESIVNSMNEKRDIGNIEAKEIMTDSLPSISPRASLDELSSLLSRNPAVLISEKGKIIGIVTKADILKAIGKR